MKRKKFGCLGLVVLFLIIGGIGAACEDLLGLGGEEMPDLEGKNVVEATDILKDLDVSDIKYQDKSGNDWVLNDIKEWVVSSQSPAADVEVSDEAVLTCTSVEAYEADKEYEKKKEALDKKLDLDSAWTAAVLYGEDEFPYGFDLHYAMGVIAEDPIDEDTWFLEAYADITNIYGTESKYICEIKVTGTTEVPEVIDFKAYEK